MEFNEIYNNSILELGLSPEYNIGEVSLASLYRQVGWKNLDDQRRFSETKVNEEAKFFFKELSNSTERDGDLLAIDDWKRIVEISLSTPKMRSQAKSKHPILYPFVPDCALYSNAARLSGNPWNPGNLIEKIILLGSDSEKEANDLWEELFQALSCNHENENEDFLARLVTQQFMPRRSKNVIWKKNDFSQKVNRIDKEILQNSPASIFAKDLKKIISLKNQLTRRQWLSTLEANVRIVCAAHILWICNLNSIIWDFYKSAFNDEIISEESLLQELKLRANELWKLEEKAVPVIKEQVQSFIKAQISIKFIINKLEKEGEEIQLKTLNDIYNVGLIIRSRIINNQWNKSVLGDINMKSEEDTRLLNCKSGISKNIFEFVRYSLGQKQTADPHKKNYDQSFWLRKNGNYSAAPWIVDLGPASILSMVYCCSYKYDQNRTIKDLLDHLGHYGIIINQNDLHRSNLLNTLSTLQVVSDSPDAEGGMVIINPFTKNRK